MPGKGDMMKHRETLYIMISFYDFLKKKIQIRILICLTPNYVQVKDPKD